MRVDTLNDDDGSFFLYLYSIPFVYVYACVIFGGSLNKIVISKLINRKRRRFSLGAAR